MALNVSVSSVPFIFVCMLVPVTHFSCHMDASINIAAHGFNIHDIVGLSPKKLAQNPLERRTIPLDQQLATLRGVHVGCSKPGVLLQSMLLPGISTSLVYIRDLPTIRAAAYFTHTYAAGRKKQSRVHMAYVDICGIEF